MSRKLMEILIEVIGSATMSNYIIEPSFLLLPKEEAFTMALRITENLCKLL